MVAMLAMAWGRGWAVGARIEMGLYNTESTATEAHVCMTVGTSASSTGGAQTNAVKKAKFHLLQSRGGCWTRATVDSIENQYSMIC